ncbi:hypothetical protein STENM223S_11152 [Streptomyces tendae]
MRGIQRLRSANAGVLLTLRTLDDVPRPLRGPLLGATGCRMALSGVTPWDGQDFAEVWGKEWTEARDVTDRQIIAESPAGKAVHALRRAITGKAPTARAVTVRQVERERWSASELAHAVPAGTRGAVADERQGRARASAPGGPAGVSGPGRPGTVR